MKELLWTRLQKKTGDYLKQKGVMLYAPDLPFISDILANKNYRTVEIRATGVQPEHLRALSKSITDLYLAQSEVAWTRAHLEAITHLRLVFLSIQLGEAPIAAEEFDPVSQFPCLEFSLEGYSTAGHIVEVAKMPYLEDLTLMIEGEKVSGADLKPLSQLHLAFLNLTILGGLSAAHVRALQPLPLRELFLQLRGEGEITREVAEALIGLGPKLEKLNIHNIREREYDAIEFSSQEKKLLEYIRAARTDLKVTTSGFNN